jgi:hypothetical protein
MEFCHAAWPELPGGIFFNPIQRFNLPAAEQ